MTAAEALRWIGPNLSACIDECPTPREIVTARNDRNRQQDRSAKRRAHHARRRAA